MKVVLEMPFLALSKVEINFAEQELTWKTYSLNEAFSTTKRVQLIDCREFVAAALILVEEVFVVHMAYLGIKISIHPAREAQIALLLAKEGSVYKKYVYFSDVFSKESAALLPARSDINEHQINLEPGKQPPYRPMYSLGPVELETFKTYIETNLASKFIQSSKSPVKPLILFVRKLDRSFCLYVD